ncbi:MAG: hypothetical protein NT002_01290 [candidate division Zixibacteria bacterium]|nr:hypothetical protein [candidate division Zixibacteria bacterium]
MKVRFVVVLALLILFLAPMGEGKDFGKNTSIGSKAPNDIFPDYIRTACKRVSFVVFGELCWPTAQNRSLNFFDDCDTTISGPGDNALIYLYDASPFLLRIKGTDTVMSSSFVGDSYDPDHGFLPYLASSTDSSAADNQYADMQGFLSSDSAIGLRWELWAPSDPDTCDFMVRRLWVWNRTSSGINGIYFGQFMDWDVPSDSVVENGSGYDTTRQLIYSFGAEYGPDQIPNNDCVPADQRMGGSAFYRGYRIPYNPVEGNILRPQGAFTGLNAEWVQPTGRVIPAKLYKKLSLFGGYETWHSGHPDMEDSLYQDIFTVTSYGKFNLGRTDTLIFIDIMLTEYDRGLTGTQEAVDQALTWIAARPNIFGPPPCQSCCQHPGDANHTGNLNIQDGTYLINYLYKGGPKPPCLEEADANGDHKIDVRDITYIIGFLYKFGHVPVCNWCSLP